MLRPLYRMSGARVTAKRTLHRGKRRTEACRPSACNSRPAGLVRIQRRSWTIWHAWSARLELLRDYRVEWMDSLTLLPNHWIAPNSLKHKNWKGFTGPAIQLSASDGGTSGRFEVARVVARVFPAHRDYVSARSSRKDSVPPQTIRSALFPRTTSPTKARNLSSSQRLRGTAASAQCPGYCRPTNPSPVLSCSASVLRSTRSCSN